MARIATCQTFEDQSYHDGGDQENEENVDKVDVIAIDLQILQICW